MNPNVIIKPTLPLRQQTGSMLLSVLFIMVVLAALMAAIATLTGQSSQQLVYEVQALKTRLIAESVLEKEVYTQLETLNETKVHEDIEGQRFVINGVAGCEGHIFDLQPQFSDEPPESEPTTLKKINIIATGTCSSGQLTIVRNIEVEVIGND